MVRHVTKVVIVGGGPAGTLLASANAFGGSASVGIGYHDFDAAGLDGTDTRHRQAVVAPSLEAAGEPNPLLGGGPLEGVEEPVVADFDSEADFLVYRNHPVHQQFIADVITGNTAGRASVQYAT